MSKERGPSLHVEWSPDRVRAIDVTTGRRYAGATLSALSPLPAGQRTVLVGISRQLVFLKCVSLPKATPEDLRRVLGVQMAQLFPLPPDQLAFDFIQTSEHLADGFLTLVAAVRSEDLRQLNSELQKAGLHATRILPVALGATAVAAKSHLAEALVVEASSAGGGFTFDVVSKGVVRLSRTAPEGADLTREAERTLAAAGIEDVTLLAAGDTESMRAATPLLPGVVTQHSAALDLLHEAPPFAFELAEDRIREKRKRINLQVRIAAVAMILSIAAAGTVWADRAQKQTTVNRGTSTWTRQITTQKSILNTEVAAAQASVDKQMTLKGAFVTPQPITDIASVAGDMLPKSVWLTGITAERGKPLQIRGTATDADDVARYLKNLTDSKRFRDVRLVVANQGRINQYSVVEFNLTAHAVGNLPMPKPTIKKSTVKAVTPASSEPKQ